MSRSLALVHTVTGLVPMFEELVRKHLPYWKPFNIVDESLLRNAISEGGLTRRNMRRVADYLGLAADGGADAILVTCSSIGPAVDAARPFCSIPVVRVDEGMAERAVELGARIGVVATLATTLEPTSALIGERAAAACKTVELLDRVCEGAFQALSEGDREKHDAIVAENISEVAERVDVIVLAQASMARVLGTPLTETVRIPTLSSPELGVLRLKARLEQSDACS